MRSYETARKIFSFLEFLAWAGVVLGALAAIGGAGAATSFSRSGAGLIAALPGILIMISGIFLVGVVQSGRASVDSAEYGQQMLQIARDQLEVSRRAIKRDAPPKGFEPLKKASADNVPSSGGYASLASDRKVNGATKTDENAFTPIDAGMGFTQLNADATELGYCDCTIRVQNGKFNVYGELFDSLDAVRVHIDNLLGQVPTETTSPILEERRVVAIEDLGTSVAPAPKVFDSNVVLGIKDGELEHAGRNIVVKNGWFFVGDQKFKTLGMAHDFIDQSASNA